MVMKEKSVQAFDYTGDLLYNYSETADTLHVDRDFINRAIRDQQLYFVNGQKETVAYHFTDNDYRVVMVYLRLMRKGNRNWTS